MMKREMTMIKKPYDWKPIIISGFGLIVAAIAVCLSWQQIQTMKDTEEKELRAYIVVDSVGFVPTNEAHVRYINMGKTPAYYFYQLSHVTSSPGPNLQDFEGVDTITTSVGPTIATGICVSHEISFTTTPSEVDSFRRGTKVLVVFGNAVYEDVFHKVHHTHFAYNWNPKDSSAQLRIHHNDAN